MVRMDQVEQVEHLVYGGLGGPAGPQWFGWPGWSGVAQPRYLRGVILDLHHQVPELSYLEMGKLPATTLRDAGPATVDTAAFHRLLNWIDNGVPSDGRSYLEMRKRLVVYFDRKNCLNADELADETLSRVTRRFAEEGSIDCETPAKYCYIVARFVFLEHLRSQRAAEIPLEEVHSEPSRSALTATDSSEEKETKELLLSCLEKCVGRLNPVERDIIIRYYYGRERAKIENRRELAQKLGISANALSIRACRIRDKLEVCVNKCVERQ